MRLDWSELAVDQLEAIREYVEQSSPEYAQILVERIARRTESLIDNPFFGAEVPEYGQESIREIFEHPYRILYQVSSELVQVLAIIHAARQMPRRPPI